MTWNNTNVVEPAWMLQDDIPWDHPGCRGSAAPHSSDSWPWGLQAGGGAQALILGSVLSTYHPSELESGDFSKTDQPWTKPFPLEKDLSCASWCLRSLHTQNTHSSAADVSEEGYPASPASFGAWLLMHLIKQRLVFLCETHHRYLFTTNNFESTGLWT